MANGLVNPNLVINGIAVAYEPNSFSYKEGSPETAANPITAGPGSVEYVYTDDISTQRGMCKFSMRSTADAINLLRSWQANREINTITATDVNFSKTFVNSIVKEDPDIALGVDATFEVTFECERVT